MITDPWFYGAAVPAVLIAGISKGGFGGGVGILAVPLMALVISPIQAAAIMLPILCLMDLIGLWAYRNHYHQANLRALLPGAVVGIGIGALSFHLLTPTDVRFMLGAIAIGFTAHYWITRPFAAANPPSTASPRVGAGGRRNYWGYFWGAMAGFTSFVAHAGAPPVNMYLLPQRLNRTLFVGTTVIFFVAVNYMKLVPYGWLGQFTAENLHTSLALIGLAPVGMAIGIWLHRRISESLFYRLCYSFVFVAGVKLVYDGIIGA